MAIADTINKASRKIPLGPIYVLAAVPPIWLLYQGLTGGLGVDPTKVMEHKMGLWGLQVLIATLSITMLRDLFKINLVRFRRPLGRIAFAYVFLHLLIWLVLDVQILSLIWADIVKRPYITIGMLGFILMIPLAVTSNDYSIRKLGAAAWKRVHWLVYPAVLLGGTHYLMLVKGWQLQPILYLAVIIAILAYKARPKRRRSKSTSRRVRT